MTSPPTEAAGAAPNDGPPARVLVVDDVAENRELVRLTLEEEGLDVRCASSGDEALAAFAAAPADAVLLDVRMPGMDGYAVCERLRALPGGADAAVLFLTALRDVDTFDRAVAAGGDDFLTKPIRPTELVVRLRSQLALRRLGGDLRAQVDVIRRQQDALVRMRLHQERLTGYLVHDLKNPVGSIDLHAQLLARQPGLPPAAAASIASIRADAARLDQLLRDLLDLGRGDEGRLVARRAPIDVAALVAELARRLAARAEAAGIRIVPRIDLPPDRLRADPGLVRRVLENLLDNALRHAPRGGSIELAARAGDGGVELVVADDGPGVPAALREAIFERYAQGAAGGGAQGLGLAFCRAALEAHGGTIALDPDAPGATFRLRFPDGE